MGGEVFQFLNTCWWGFTHEGYSRAGGVGACQKDELSIFFIYYREAMYALISPTLGLLLLCVCCFNVRVCVLAFASQAPKKYVAAFGPSLSTSRRNVRNLRHSGPWTPQTTRIPMSPLCLCFSSWHGCPSMNSGIFDGSPSSASTEPASMPLSFTRTRVRNKRGKRVRIFPLQREMRG